MLPATLKPRSDLLVATGTANTANPVSRNKPRFWTPIPEYYSNGIESRPSSNTVPHIPHTVTGSLRTPFFQKIELFFEGAT